MYAWKGSVCVCICCMWACLCVCVCLLQDCRNCSDEIFMIPQVHVSHIHLNFNLSTHTCTLTHTHTCRSECPCGTCKPQLSSRNSCTQHPVCRAVKTCSRHLNNLQISIIIYATRRKWVIWRIKLLHNAFPSQRKLWLRQGVQLQWVIYKVRCCNEIIRVPCSYEQI